MSSEWGKTKLAYCKFIPVSHIALAGAQRSEPTKRPLTEAYAEAVADGVCVLKMAKITHVENAVQIESHCFIKHRYHPAYADSQVPAVTIEKIHHGALEEAGLTVREAKSHNVSRDAYRSIQRMGIGWKVKQDVYEYRCDDGSCIPIHYLRPKKLLEYIIAKEPHLVFGAGGIDSLASFWHGYGMYHGEHAVFTDNFDLTQTIPLAIHGDEGRGKRRSSTAVISLEAVLGIKSNVVPCSCKPVHMDAYTHDVSDMDREANKLVCNLKGHSFLQHWPLVVLPGTYAKTFKDMTLKLLELIGDDLRDLYHNGLTVNGRKFYVAIVGAKGDLKWFSKICRLTRGYENKGRKTDVPCCNLCMAGTAALPAEDFTAVPAWASTMFQERPWNEGQGGPALNAVPFDPSKPEFMYKHDILHTLRLGVFRDFAASVIFLYLRWNYFGGRGKVSEKLEVAYSHFKLWLSAANKWASLRSFTPQLFKYTNQKSYPWANVKGSDCALMLQWIATLTVGIMNDSPPEWQVPVLQVILATTRMATSFYKHMCNHSMFQFRNCGAVLYERGQSFINGYMWLAKWAFENQHCLFSVKPKMHFLKHLLLEIKTQLDNGDALVANPLLFDCSQCEDLIGRTCRLGRRVDGRVISSRVLINFLIKVYLLAKRERPR